MIEKLKPDERTVFRRRNIGFIEKIENSRKNETAAVPAKIWLRLLSEEKLRFTRMAGTAATTFLEDATMEQAEQIMELDYIHSSCPR